MKSQTCWEKNEPSFFLQEFPQGTEFGSYHLFIEEMLCARHCARYFTCVSFTKTCKLGNVNPFYR